MPRFFFDIFDGERLFADAEGSMHPDLEKARHEALDTLTSMSRTIFPRDGATSLSVDIRPDTGEAIERIVITLSFQKL